MRVERLGSFAFDRRQMAKRIANYISYLVLALCRGLTVRSDVIFVMTDPPITSLVGNIISALRRVPLVYHVQDLHPDMGIAARLVRPGLLSRVWDRVHLWTMQRARLVIVLGNDMRKRVVGKGVSSTRVAVVRSGANVPSELPGRDHRVVREIRCGFSFVLLHAGNLGFAGAWETVIEAASRLEKLGVGLVFVGDGVASRFLRERTEGLRNVRFLAYRPESQLPYVLQAGDVHLVTLRRGMEGLVVPSKLYPILGAGRPVLALVPKGSDIAEIVQSTRCGWVADPDDSDSMVAVLQQAVNDMGELETRGRRARVASRMFERSTLLRELVRKVELATPD